MTMYYTEMYGNTTSSKDYLFYSTGLQTATLLRRTVQTVRKQFSPLYAQIFLTLDMCFSGSFPEKQV